MRKAGAHLVQVNLQFSFMGPEKLGPVVQSIVSQTSLLMTNSLTFVAKVFSNTLIFFAEKMRVAFAFLLAFFQQKILMYLPYFKIEILTSC